jgi:hypothetical protein
MGKSPVRRNEYPCATTMTTICSWTMRENVVKWRADGVAVFSGVIQVSVKAKKSRDNGSIG